jgi:hypothetical protein
MMRNESSIPTGKFSDFFQLFTGVSCRKNRKLARNQWKKSEDFPTGLLLPCSADFQCFPAGTGPYFLTWIDTKKRNIILILCY